MSLRQTLICKRLRAIGLEPAAVHRILNTVDHWVSCNGPEWVVTRLKDLKSLFVSRLTDQPVDDHRWIAFRGDVPLGPFRCLFRRALSAYGRRADKKVQDVLSGLMCYSAFVREQGTVSRSQWSKIRKTTGHEAEIGLDLKILHPYLRPIARSVAASFLRCGPDVASEWTHRGGAPALTSKSMPELDPFYESLFSKTLQRYLQRFLGTYTRCNNQAWRTIAASYVPYQRRSYDLYSDGGVVGAFRVKQQPGFKARAVASLHPIYQGLSSHIGNSLYDTLDSIPEDCRKKQSKGYHDAQDWLRRGNRLTSLDLSSATDTCPYALQRQLLLLVEKELIRSIGIEQAGSKGPVEAFRLQLDLVDAITHGLYECNTVLTNARGKVLKVLCTVVQYKSGQPMGSLFSYALFSLVHHAIVRSCKPAFYRILGDDLIIDPEAGKRVLHLYALLGMPVSLDKSIIDSHYCEFAGVLAREDRIFNQPKVRQITAENCISIYKNLGPASIGLFQPKWRGILRLLDRCVPEIWDLATGFNTKGEKYRDRVNLTNVVRGLLESYHAQDSIPDSTDLLIRSVALRSYRPRVARQILADYDEMTTVTKQKILESFDFLHTMRKAVGLSGHMEVPVCHRSKARRLGVTPLSVLRSVVRTLESWGLDRALSASIVTGHRPVAEYSDRFRDKSGAASQLTLDTQEGSGLHL